MGTVGLSFGSPTSGAGFNVSSTVAEIVGNLQNVETPWKTQLTSLESQDTTISSLGTLFSNLSNDMSSLTDFQGILAQKEGSSSDTSVIELTAASSSATAGTHSVVVNNLAQTSSGYLDAIANASDALSGSMTIQLGNGTTENVVIGTGSAANTIYTGSGKNTLADIASAINSANLGLTANVLADSSGSRLSLVSGASGAASQLAVTSALTDPNNVTATNTTGTLNYNVGVDGKDASLTIDGVPLTSASNTVSNLIPGVTFQLLAPSPVESGTTLESVQVVIANDNSGVESTVNQFVTDYNSLISAINTQEGSTSSGTPEPLFGSPTLSLLQQQLLSSLNSESPDGYLDSVSSTAGATLSGSIGISLAGGIPLYYSGAAGSGTLAPINNAGDTLSGSLTIQVGNGTAQTVNVGDSSTPHTLAGLAQAITQANIGVSAQVESNATSSWLSLTSGTTGTAGTLTVDSSIADTSPQTIQVPTSSGNNTLAGLASAINSSLSGATAAVVTTDGESTLTLMSEAEGTSGALTVTSALTSSAPTPLKYTDTTPYTSSTPDIGTLGAVTGSGDTLSGAFTIQVGSGTAQTITLDSSNNTLTGLMGAINGLSGVSAVLDQAGTGLTLTSATNGAAGALTVTSSIVDTTSPTTTALNYNTSSDINSLTSLGISVNNDGSLTFDADSLDSVLNTDYSSVAGFFQNANSWGQAFINMLTNAGTSSPTGILSLASSSNSTVESTLNADISREQSLISAEQSSLTTELNSANQVMQQLPTQLEGVNELYSAITGYDQNMKG